MIYTQKERLDWLEDQHVDNGTRTIASILFSVEIFLRERGFADAADAIVANAVPLIGRGPIPVLREIDATATFRT